MTDGMVGVIGGGPAGLTAAYALSRRGVPPRLFEASEHLGGISRTEVYRGFRFDIGGHRFFTKIPEVEALWREILEDDFLERPRLSRIYYNHTFFDYPLSPFNALWGLGLWRSCNILRSYMWAQLRPIQPEENFAQWVTNRFSKVLFKTFFEAYTEKVWGIPCTEIRADWAAQRIKDLSLKKAIFDALKGFGGKGTPTSLIKQFNYPRLGPGMLWDRCGELIERNGGTLYRQTAVRGLHHAGGRVHSLKLDGPAGDANVSVDYVINSMPIHLLVRSLQPAAPTAVLKASQGLKYRDFLVVAVIVDQAEVFPDNWIYVHDPTVRVGRIQNFKNWSPEMVPDPSLTCLGMEYFCQCDDALWQMEDRLLIDLAAKELEQIGLAQASTVRDGHIIRQRHAYPVYDATYKEHLAVIRDYLAGFSNLVSVGRGGLHRYNNQDHSMLTALMAVENYFGAQHDVWEVNTERSYHEDFQHAREQSMQTTATGDQAPVVYKG